jgi:hypothetical protein
MAIGFTICALLDDAELTATSMTKANILILVAPYLCGLQQSTF